MEKWKPFPIAAGDVQSHWYIRIVRQAALQNTPDVDMCGNDKRTLTSPLISNREVLDLWISNVTCFFFFLFCVIVFFLYCLNAEPKKKKTKINTIEKLVEIEMVYILKRNVDFVSCVFLSIKTAKPHIFTSINNLLRAVDFVVFLADD